MRSKRNKFFSSNKPAVFAMALSLMLSGPLTPRGAGAQACTICNLVERIDISSIASVIRAISGEDSVTVDGSRELITTRYAFSPGVRIAMKYLGEVAASYGYSPEYRPFVLAVDTPDLTGMTVSRAGDSVWAGSTDGDVYLATSASGWSGFERAGSMEGRIFDLVTAADGDLFAACKKTGSGFGCIYSSSDGGANWQLELDGALGSRYQFNTITFWDDRFGIAGGHGGSFMNTAEGGHSWFVAAGPEQFLYQNINGSAATGPTHYWVACNGGYIFESVDFGYNWTPNKLADTPLYDIDFHDPMRGVAVGINLVFYTTDGGLSWTGVSHPSSLQNVTMLDSVNVLAAGGEGEMWKSGDGGATWAPLGPGCAGMETIWRFDTGPDGRIWAAGDNSILRVEPEWQVSAECATYTVADTIFGRNIVFSRLGWKYPDRKILLCGHYDSTNRATDPMVCAPGADDNGSGTSIVLECARVLSEVSLEKTVEFALFDGEENGLVGSVAFATAVDTDEVYEAVINLDMVGADYTGDGKIRLGAIQDTPDTVLVAELTLASDYFARLYTIDWYYRTRTDQPMTDDLAFKGVLDIPAVSLIESGYRDNPHYHNCTDLFQYLDMDYMHDVARIVIATAGKMAGLGAEPAADVVLHQNFPNPFFSTTVVVFEIPARSHVRLAIYDVAGRKVRVLEDGVMDAGIYPVLWDGLSAGGEKVSSGVYFLRLEAGGTERSIKIVRIH